MDFIDQNTETENYKKALKQVKKIKGFYVHLLIYLVISGMILGVNMYYTKPPESIFRLQNFSTLFFWGIGILAHAVSVFIPQLTFTKAWEEKKIKEIMERHKNNDV